MSKNLQNYASLVASTDRLNDNDLKPILIGIFSEIGSTLAPAKKLIREKEVYSNYYSETEEELGDVLWYFVALLNRLKLNPEDFLNQDVSNDLEADPISILLNLSQKSANLIQLIDKPNDHLDVLADFAKAYLRVVSKTKINLDNVILKNSQKVKGRFLKTPISELPEFDLTFPDKERFPRQFTVKIWEDEDGKASMELEGKSVGNTLTDNIMASDGFRFHDVLHMGNAAILHWSPTFRGLNRRKRKSNAMVDENQDGGRAVVVEEGLIAWLFTHAKRLNYFEGQNGVSLDLLKIIEQFIRGYEVEACPLSLWEDCILQSYNVFRQIKAHKGGYVIGDLDARTLTYKPLSNG